MNLVVVVSTPSWTTAPTDMTVGGRKPLCLLVTCVPDCRGVIAMSLLVAKLNTSIVVWLCSSVTRLLHGHQALVTKSYEFEPTMRDGPFDRWHE